MKFTRRGKTRRHPLGGWFDPFIMAELAVIVDHRMMLDQAARAADERVA